MSSNSDAQEQQPSQGEKFMKKAERQLCWSSKDSFWECLRRNGEDRTKCQAERQRYEQDCPASWVTHFDRKFQYEKFKMKLKTDGFQQLDDNFSKNRQEKAP